MAASNVLMLKKAGDKRQEQALQEAFKVSNKSSKVRNKYPKQVSKKYPRSKQEISQAGKQKIF
jgi:ubiquitin